MTLSNPREIELIHAREMDMWRAYIATMRPTEPMSPSEFSRRYRQLHAIYCSERPGRWDDSAFPYQAPIMDAGEEAIRTGKRGIVLMKSGQGGGTDCMINLSLWLKEYYPGPQLFMTSTEKVASEFGRERFANIIRDMPPLRDKFLPAKRGGILVKRFVDGAIQLCGGQSVYNVQSTPRRIVTIDELDSIPLNLGNEGNPVRLAEIRLDSFSGPTLMIAYAHPTTKDRGAAQLYYENSDQRRGFVTCPHEGCGHEFYLQWDHVKAVPNDQVTTDAKAKRDADCYAYYCPGCGCQIDDSQRVAMVRKVNYRSVLAPEVAAKKTWIGVHFSQLYYPSKTIRFLAQAYIDALDDEESMKVFYNKRLGEPYEKTIKDVSIEDLRRLIVVPRRENDPEAYYKGTVPPGVRFLTFGQDSRDAEFHYSVWGWGLARLTNKSEVLRAWLIDWDVIKRTPPSSIILSADLSIFDQLLYNRFYPTTYSNTSFEIREGAHDTGYSPHGVYEYTRGHEWRAIPIKGDNSTSLSQRPLWREGYRPKYKMNGEEIELNQPLIFFNTYQLKFEWYASLTKKVEVFEYENGRDFEPTGTRNVPLITLPIDVDEAWLAQSSSEYLGYGKKKGEKIWDHKGPNHWGDCNIYALGLAKKINPFQSGLSFDEADQLARMEEKNECLKNWKHNVGSCNNPNRNLC